MTDTEKGAAAPRGRWAAVRRFLDDVDILELLQSGARIVMAFFRGIP